MPCSNAAKMQNPLKFVGVPQTPEPISTVSGPKFTILSGHVEEVLLFNNFFPIVDKCLSCAMVPRWRFFVFAWRRVQRISDLHSKLALRPHHVNIQSPTADIRRGKKRKKKERRNSMKIQWCALFHRATIINSAESDSKRARAAHAHGAIALFTDVIVVRTVHCADVGASRRVSACSSSSSGRDVTTSSLRKTTASCIDLPVLAVRQRLPSSAFGFTHLEQFWVYYTPIRQPMDSYFCEICR